MSIPIRFTHFYFAIWIWWALTCVAVMTVASSWQIPVLVVMLAPSAIFGILLFCRRLTVKCDFCGSYGRLAYGYQEGYEDTRPRLDCERCGRVFIRGLKACRDKSPEE